MTDETGGEAAVVENEEAAPEAAVSSQEPAQEPVQERDYESEAREMGWVPKEEFRGPDGRWKDAKTFVEDGENILPIVRAENKRLKAEIEKINADYATRFERLDKAAQASIKAAKAQFDARLADLTAKRDAAVEAGDVAEFKAIDKQITDHTANAPKVEDFEEPKADDAKASADALEAWQKANPWYGTDDDLTEAAIGISQNLLRKNPGISMAENLRLTDAEMRKRFPLRFGGAGANGHAPVDSGGTPKSSRTDTLTSKLPPEALAMAKQAVRDGTYKTTEEWAKVYFE